MNECTHPDEVLARVGTMVAWQCIDCGHLEVTGMTVAEFVSGS